MVLTVSLCRAGVTKQIKCYQENKPLLYQTDAAPRPALTAARMAGLRDGARGFVHIEAVGGGHMPLREKALEPLALND